MKRRPITIYLAPNITDITLLRPLLTLFVQQVMDILTLEHDPNSVPVYFLLDEFRQLKRMDEIMTKLPYVAGYKIKLAFIIQDLKNLDEIYGETSRHSLLGNCGYQLILGANDQATAEYASRALGKRTIRYQSESRTIELMGLPRRTKVEQIRDRDLMMPQEVRQMPENKMILLVEGQRPIFGEKLRFFKTQPFKEAEAYSQAHIPTVPTVDYLPPKPVPATTPAYANAGQEQTEEAEAIKPAPEAQAEELQAPVQKETPKEPSPSTSPARVVNRAALASKKASVAGGSPEPAKAAVPAPEKRPMPVSEDEIEKAHNDRVSRLKEVVDREAEGKSPRKRKSLEELFAATVPDPIMEPAGR